MYRWQISINRIDEEYLFFLINSVLYSVLKAYKSKIKTISVFENFKTWLAVDHLSILTGVVGGKVSAPWNHPFPPYPYRWSQSWCSSHDLFFGALCFIKVSRNSQTVLLFIPLYKVHKSAFWFQWLLKSGNKTGVVWVSICRVNTQLSTSSWLLLTSNTEGSFVSLRV